MVVTVRVCAMLVGAMTVVRTILVRVRIVVVMIAIVMSMLVMSMAVMRMAVMRMAVMSAVRVSVRVVRCHRSIVQETRGRTLSARPLARGAALGATRLCEERESERPEDRRDRRKTITAEHRQRIEQPTVGAILLR